MDTSTLEQLVVCGFEWTWLSGKPSSLLESQPILITKKDLADFEDEKRNGAAVASVDKTHLVSARWIHRLLRWRVETRGISPIPLHERTDVAYSRMFTFWMAISVNVLPFFTGLLGPLLYGLSTRDSCLVIFFINVLSTIPPAYFVTLGPKLGLRQTILAKYSFGQYLVIPIVLFNLVGLLGFNIISSILGGQTLSSITDGRMSWTVGIVIIAVIALVVSFMGYTVLHWYERLSWVPVLITFLITVGVGGKHLKNPVEFAPATAPVVLSFASAIAGFMVSYVCISADFACYMPPDAPSSHLGSKLLFWYTYFGLLIPTVVLQCLGAAVGACIPNVPSWQVGYENGSTGGLLAAMLSPIGGFGKFLLVLLSLSVTGSIAAGFYSLSLNFQVISPFLRRVPRCVLSIVGTAIVIPLAIAGGHRFFDTLSDFLGIIGYWTSAYGTILALEHFIFRHGNAAEYDVSTWDRASKLPYGVAAILSLAIAFGIAVPAMDQVWYVGPIAKTTGDLGFELAFVAALVVYPPLRWLEIRFSGHV
ncbi:NCS cytosine-purine permease [Hysterangium stoloniferum]|nr:NCS cytosine-purine permease [Hysterangium stoloniferum]